ncbi:MAG: hypothetical protein AAF357_15775 [Verrucomicrobiota bacterium]
MMNIDVENSFKNFHAKGLDYICLSRTPALTKKLYILDGDASKVPEVVNPHDHRYIFKTTVLKGKMIDHRWKSTPLRGVPYNAFDYRTPLNGGDGFTFRGVEHLTHVQERLMSRHQFLVTDIDNIHTIQMWADQTVLLLEQYEDTVPIDQPTSTCSKGTPSISDSGLYEKFTEGEIIDRLRQVGLAHYA